MRHLSNEPLMGVAVYNPGILSKDELVRLFVARRNLLQQIVDDLRRETINSIAQHRLLVGARGMGKSTLLRRISYAVEDDPALSAIWIPLTFPEEQYNVARLSDLWLNCLDALSDALERSGNHDEAQALDDIVDALPAKNEEERARKALNALLEHAQQIGKRLLLLIDNVDLILDRLAKDHWSIREMLSKEGAPLLVGATSRPLEPTYVYQGAFYDFFRIDNLSKLHLEEMREVLQTLAAECNAPHVTKLLEDDPARIRVLYDLTGGNPRTTILLFGVLTQGIDGDVRTDLERLLDQCTPLYKARFEELSNQAQQVVDALALHWDPATAAAVSEKARLDVNTVSSHLNRLSEQGIVEKVRLYPKKKAGFQLSERFFNIWYLMRASRRMRRKLIWLSRFLRSFYTQQDLHGLAQRYLHKRQNLAPDALFKHAEYGFALAEALEDQCWRRALEHTASLITLDLQQQFQAFIGDSAIGIEEIDKNSLTMNKIKERVLNLQLNTDSIDGKIDFCKLLCGCPILNLINKEKIVESIEKKGQDSTVRLLPFLIKVKEVLIETYQSATLINAVYEAINSGLMEGLDDVRGAESAVLVFDEPAILTVALSRQLARKENVGTLESFARRLEETRPDVSWGWLQLGEAQRRMGRTDAAQKTLFTALELCPDDPEVLSALGSSLAAAGRYEEAVSFLEKAIVLAPDESSSLVELGTVLIHLDEMEEAERSIRAAIDISPNNQWAWLKLGAINRIIHDDVEASDEDFKVAIDVCEKPETLAGIAEILRGLRSLNLAEYAYGKALNLKPNDVPLKIRLAAVMALNENWAKAAEHVASALTSTSAEDVAEIGEALISFTKAAVTSGCKKEALDLLEQNQAAEYCRPLIEGLRGVVAGTAEYFINVAPEIRNATVEIYKVLIGDELQVQD